jgi:hypothetical protein
MAEDTKTGSPTQKTPTQEQMNTQSSGTTMAPSATTGSGNITGQDASKIPGKPTDSVKDSATSGGDASGAGAAGTGAGGAGAGGAGAGGAGAGGAGGGGAQ